MYLIACDNIIRDDALLKPSLIGIFDVLVIPQGQTKLLYSFMVGGKFYTPTLGELSTKIKIIDPNKKLFKETEVLGSVNSGDTDLKASFPFAEFTLRGKYLLKLSMGGVDMEDNDRFYFIVL